MSQKIRKQKYREIEKAFSQQNQSAVIELSENHIKEFPDDFAVWYFYARCLSNSSRYKEAIFWYSKLIRLLERSKPELLSSPYSGLGNLYKRKGNFRKAIDWYKKASEIEPDEASYLIFLGVLHYRLGEFDKAQVILEQATKCKNGCIDEAFYNLGIVLASKKRYKEALANFERAVEIDFEYKLARSNIKDIKKTLKFLES